MTHRHLQEKLRAFNRARDWEQFHSPRNLTLAMVGEVGEVASLVQWIGDNEFDEWLSRYENRKRLESELADVYSYLLQLADVVAIDVESALLEKIQLNEERYPISRSKGSRSKHTEHG